MESASRIKIAPGITELFGIKPMCNDVPRQKERERENLVSFRRYRLLSTPEQRLGSASILERAVSGILVSRKAYMKRCTYIDVGLPR